MTPWGRYFHGAQGASRAFFLEKAFLAMLALDAWTLMIGHAGRYGAGGFNVAHFAWLDGLVPLPTPALYIATVALAGLLALSIFFGGHARLPLVALCVLYTFSWAMSMLDSYQHHYFMSLVLVCLIFTPRVHASDLHPPPPRRPDGALKPKKQREFERIEQKELRGWVYVVAVFATAGLCVWIGPGEHTWPTFLLFVTAVGVMTALRSPVRHDPATLATGWGLPLLGATIGVLYTFTAIAKMDARWIEGHTLLAISKVETLYGSLADYMVRLGIERDAFWAALSTGVIPLELMVALGYVIAVLQDRAGMDALRWPCFVAWAFAMMLHVGAEAMGLQIGWFSYYMMLLASALLLPLGTVDTLATIFTWPARALSSQLDDATGSEGVPAVLATALLAAATLGIAGYMVDLPGALVACGLAGGALLGAVGWLATRRDFASCRRWAAASTAAGLCFWIAIATSPARYDYYRYLGGDLRRRGEPAAALEAYLKAERYAPAGTSRRDKIDELREELGK